MAPTAARSGATAPGSTPSSRRRVHGRVEGTVQGVGFRPYVHRLARELGLGGTVGNDERGVLLEVEGDPEAVAAFLHRLPGEAPPLARVERVLVREIPATGDRAFTIVASERHGTSSALVVPDAATCEDCLAELRDPADRRHRYPFVNCTNCGPRFTIVRDVPYDRPNTTMAGFSMCPACRAEYEDPVDRRFHAQPNACPVCGPQARLLDGAGAEIPVPDAVRAAADALRTGRIVAVKGLGGYHLACRADDQAAVATLRERKHRDEKPFAVMVAGLTAAGALVSLDEHDGARLSGPARPIVLAPRRPGAAVASAVAPGCAELGVMLPYTPLHHLLLADLGEAAPDGGPPLVLTSGNRSDEPIVYRDEDVLVGLGGIADLFLVHDRPIHVRTDDSVVRGRVMVRRSRGYVPGSVELPIEAPPLLATGAELKSTFCVAKGRRAWVGHHIGDLKSWETLRAFREGVDHFERLFAVTPELVAHDLHPDYLSTTEALRREDVRTVGVQHHHAHLAAGLAEHGETGPAVGAIYDGVGYGSDGTAWGGEILVGDLAEFRRAGRLWPVALPGGDRAAREPWRMACSWLVAAGRDDRPATLVGAASDEAWRATVRMAQTGFAASPTTSMGRLFDAVAALCGVRTRNTYEGQAAIELEAAADPDERGSYPVSVVQDDDGGLLLDPRETVLRIAGDVAGGRSAAAVSARFHAGLAEATAAILATTAAGAGIGVVVLSGGVFANRRLLGGVQRGLAGSGLRVLVPERLPPGDGGISYGQAAVAAASGDAAKA